MALNDSDIQSIRTLVADHTPWLAELRHGLHAIPEPAFAEHETAATVAQTAIDLGFSVRRNVGGTGVVADLAGDASGPCIALRADMDALARGDGEGYGHYCGHDGNMAAVLGAARILREMHDRLGGSLRLIFQPAEETGCGAMALIAAGVLTDRPIAAILGAHGWPGTDLGTVACRPGAMLASCDDFRITFTGRGGHGARPGLAINPIDGMSRAAVALNALTTDTRVVSVCVSQAGQSLNVIPDTGFLRGSMRALDEPTRTKTLDEMKAVITEACTPAGLTAELESETHCPVVRIDEKLYDVFRQAGAAVVGEERVVELPEPSMGSEDFGWYLQEVPGLMFRVGMGTDCPSLHNAAFEYSDEVLAPAAGTLAAMALQLSQEPPAS